MPKANAIAHLTRVRRDLAKMTDMADIKEVADKSETLARYYRKSIKDIRAANACAEAVLWAWVRMGEIVNGQAPGRGKRSRRGPFRVVDIAKDLGLGQTAVKRWQLAAKLNEDANFDALLADYRDDECEPLDPLPAGHFGCIYVDPPIVALRACIRSEFGLIASST